MRRCCWSKNECNGSTRPLFTACSGSFSNGKEKPQTSSGNDNRLIGRSTCKRQGSLWMQQQHTVEHLLFDCEALGQVIFATFGLVSKGGGILKKNLTGCILENCTLMDFLQVQGEQQQ